MHFLKACALALLVFTIGGHSAFAADAVENSDLTYTHEEKEKDDGNFQNDLVFNDASGKKAAAFSFEEDSGSVWTVSLSPDGSILALLTGLECGTTWRFFDFPSGAPRGETFPGWQGLGWIDGKTAVFTHSRDLEEIRRCESQCCQGLSLARYAMGGELDFLAEATAECDFEFQKMDGAAVLAEKTCMSPEKRRTMESGTSETVRYNLK